MGKKTCLTLIFTASLILVSPLYADNTGQEETDIATSLIAEGYIFGSGYIIGQAGSYLVHTCYQADDIHPKDRILRYLATQLGSGSIVALCAAVMFLQDKAVAPNRWKFTLFLCGGLASGCLTHAMETHLYQDDERKDDDIDAKHYNSNEL